MFNNSVNIMQPFDNEAHHYDDWYNTRLGALVDEVETNLIWELLEPLPGMKILDVGCGTGNYSIKLAKHGCLVTGMDVSTKMISNARKKAAEENLNIEFIEAPSENIPFDEDSFDAVISVTAFEFIQNTKKSIDEMIRVVKKEGHVVIGTINASSIWGELYLTKEFQEHSVFKYANFLRRADLASLKPDKLITIKHALHFPPDIQGEDLDIKLERDYFKDREAGFLGALWQK